MHSLLVGFQFQISRFKIRGSKYLANLAGDVDVSAPEKSVFLDKLEVVFASVAISAMMR